MRILLLINLLFICFSTQNLYAIKDFIEKPHFNQISKSSQEHYNFPKLLNSEKIESDEYNFYYYTPHFRIICGNYFKDYPSVNNFMKQIGEIAEIIWQKEIEDLSFKPPLNSEKYFIDIYIGNKSAYNPVLDKYISIYTGYSGYATYYPDRTPYFVINPEIYINMLKVTLAHEFFHTIQFSYYDLLSIDDDVFDKNLWWLESTAVWMESVVFPEIKDFTSFLNNWIFSSYFSITLCNGEHEYGDAIIPIYLFKENDNNTIKFIKDTFINFSKYKNFLKYIELNIEKYFKEKSLAELLINIGKCILLKECFYNELNENFREFSIKELNLSGSYGLYFFSPIDDYKDFYIESPVLSIYKKDNIGFFVPKNSKLVDKNLPLDSVLDFLKNGEVSLSKAWNLIANPTYDKANFNEIFNINDKYIIWKYDDNSWAAWSNDNYINLILNKFGVYTQNQYLMKNEGFWAYLFKDNTLKLLKNNLTLKQVQYNNEKWQIINFGIPLISVEDIKDYFYKNFYLWGYDKGQWSIYSNNTELINELFNNFNIKPLKNVGYNNSYWLNFN